MNTYSKHESEITKIAYLTSELNSAVLENMTFLDNYNDIYDQSLLHYIKRNRALIIKNLTRLKHAIKTEEITLQLDRFGSLLGEKETLRNNIIAAVDRHENIKKITVMRHQREIVDKEATSYLNRIMEIQKNELSNIMLLHAMLRVQLEKSMIAMIVLILIMTIFIFYVIARSITVPIKLISALVKEITNGNFSARTAISSKDELGMLAKFLNEMTEKLEKTHQLMINITDDLKLKLVTEKKAEAVLEEQTVEMERIAYHDHVTGLPNRILFEKLFEQALIDLKRDRRKAAMIFIDIRYFRNLNETLGHNLGDVLLEEVANRISALKKPGDIVTRFVGDMFVVLSSDIQNVNQVEMIVDLFLTAFDKPFQLNGYSISTSANVGVALYPDMGETFATLTKNADAALYRAKKLEKDKVIFSTALDNERKQFFNIEIKLREAISKKYFFLAYQPIVNSNRSLYCVEVLLRWDSFLFPSGITNSDIIPVAEESGLIVELGNAIVEAALLQYKKWSQTHYQQIKMSINLSTKQVIQKNFITWISDLFSELKIDPKQIIFEITETAIVKDIIVTMNNLNALRAMGCGIWIDDFGTGYASLNLIKRLPITGIKIDKSFVQRELNDSKNTALLKMIFSLAESMDCVVISEGVETEAQFNFIRSLAPNQKMQGFYISPGLVASDIEKQF